MGTQTYTLEQLADAVGMTPRNVRAYQARGLIGPPRRQGRGVVYDEAHRHRLMRVRAAVTQGVQLKHLAALVTQGRLEELEEVVRRLRPSDTATIDLTMPERNRRVLHPDLTDHLNRTAPETVATLLELGVFTRDGDDLVVPAVLGDPLHELYADAPSVLGHALTTAVAAATSLPAGTDGTDGEPTTDDEGVPRQARRLVDLVQRVHWAVVTTASVERVAR